MSTGATTRLAPDARVSLFTAGSGTGAAGSGQDGAVAYDAFLLLSFGGPEHPDDVLPFLQNVTRGRGVPPERLAAVAEHYHRFGGVSPINEQCRALLAAVTAEFAAHGPALPTYWGNRNWRPMLADTVAQMRDDGVRSVLAFATSAYGGYSSCRQYHEDIAAAPKAESTRERWIWRRSPPLLPDKVSADSRLATSAKGVPPAISS